MENKTEIEELKEEIVRLQSIIDGDFEVKSFHFEDGKFDAAFEGSVVKVIAAELVNLYKSAGGDNYLSLELRDPDTEERFEIIIQRCLGERPAEKAKRLQKKIDAIKHRLDQYDDPNAGVKTVQGGRDVVMDIAEILNYRPADKYNPGKDLV